MTRRFITPNNHRKNGHRGSALLPVPFGLVSQAVDISASLEGDDKIVPGAAVMVMLAHQDPMVGVVIKVWPQDTMVKAHKEHPLDEEREVPWEGTRPLLRVKAFRPVSGTMRLQHPEQYDGKDLEEVIIDKIPWKGDVEAQAKAAGYPTSMSRQVHTYAVVHELNAH